MEVLVDGYYFFVFIVSYFYVLKEFVSYYFKCIFRLWLIKNKNKKVIQFVFYNYFDCILGIVFCFDIYINNVFYK